MQITIDEKRVEKGNQETLISLKKIMIERLKYGEKT